MTLLPHEEQLVVSNANKIVLTNQRIWMTNKEWGNSYSIVIFLEDIRSVETKYTSNTLFLALTCTGFLGSFYWFSFFFGSLIFGLLWWSMRRHIISISAGSGVSLNFRIDQLSESEVAEFIDSIQEAKAKRIEQLYK